MSAVSLLDDLLIFGISTHERVMKVLNPTRISAAGNKPKSIDEFFGKVNSGSSDISIARMVSPEGWIEPYQQPEFNEYSVVLKGMLKVELNDSEFEVRAGQAIQVPAGVRVRYSTPEEGGAEYMAICTPAFSPDTVNRED